jgi:3-ketosteroid 9alpha-monooxygenase subunit A
MISADGVLESDAFHTGRGILLARYSSETDAVQTITHTPVEDGVIQIWHGLISRSHNTPASAADDGLNSAYHRPGLAAPFQDVAIWPTMQPAISPPRMSADGPFKQARTRRRQFYNGGARATGFQARANRPHLTREMAAHHSNAA